MTLTYPACMQANAQQVPQGLTRQQREESADMAEALRKWKDSKEGAKWQQDRERLPVLSIKQDLLAQLQQNDVVVVSGDTGCGKTTQVGFAVLSGADALEC